MFLLAVVAVCATIPFWSVTTYISMACVVTFLCVEYNYDYARIIKYLNVYFSFIIAILGVFAIESVEAIYLVELRMTSHRAGSLPLFCIAYMILLITIKFVDAKFGFEIKSIRKWKHFEKRVSVCNIFAFTISVVCLYLFMQVAKHPAFMLGLDRFSYGAYIGFNRTTSILSKRASLFTILIVISAVYGNRIISVTGLALYS